MPKETSASKLRKFTELFELEGAISIILIILLVYLFLQNLSLQYNSSNMEAQNMNLENNYNRVQVALTDSDGLLKSLQNSYAQLEFQYNESLYGNPHGTPTVLFSNYTLKLPAATYNQYNLSNGKLNTNPTWTSANFTYYFNATHPGYLLFNATPGRNSNLKYVTVGESATMPYQKYGKVYSNASYSIAPASGVTYTIPILAGPNYFFMNNVNATEAQTLNFSLSYVPT